MRVDDAVDVRASAHQLGVDRILGVTAVLTLEQLPVPRDEDHMVGRDFLEAERRRFHPDSAAPWIACRHVTPDEVALILELQDPAAEGNLGA